MNWFERVKSWGRSRPGASASAGTPSDRWTVPGIFFDTAGWTLTEGTADRMMWTAPDATLTLTHVSDGVAWRPRTLTDLRAHWRETCRAVGEDIVLVEPLEPAVPAGHTALVVVVKIRQGMAANYRALVETRVSPVDGFLIRAEFREGRTTGMRDAVVSGAIVSTCGLHLEDAVEPNGGRRIKGAFQDAYDATFDAGALNGPSDDDRVDVALPEHPLSRSRAWLRVLQRSIRFADTAGTFQMILDQQPPAQRGPRKLLQGITLRHIYDTTGAMEPLANLLQAEIAEAGPEPTTGLALLHLYLGCVQCQRKRFSEAIGPLERALEMYDALGQGTSFCVAEAATRLGQALVHVGRLPEALAAFRRAIPLFREHPADQVDHLEALATSQAAALLSTSDDPVDRQQSRAYLEKARALMERVEARRGSDRERR